MLITDIEPDMFTPNTESYENPKMENIESFQPPVENVKKKLNYCTQYFMSGS